MIIIDSKLDVKSKIISIAQTSSRFRSRRLDLDLDRSINVESRFDPDCQTDLNLHYI